DDLDLPAHRVAPMQRYHQATQGTWSTAPRAPTEPPRRPSLLATALDPPMPARADAVVVLASPQSRSKWTRIGRRRPQRRQGTRWFVKGGRSACSTGAVVTVLVYHGRPAVRFWSRAELLSDNASLWLAMETMRQRAEREPLPTAGQDGRPADEGSP